MPRHKPIGTIKTLALVNAATHFHLLIIILIVMTNKAYSVFFRTIYYRIYYYIVKVCRKTSISQSIMFVYIFLQLSGNLFSRQTLYRAQNNTRVFLVYFVKHTNRQGVFSSADFHRKTGLTELPDKPVFAPAE